MIINIKRQKCKWIMLFVFSLYTLFTSWISDDAYHAFIMAKNLVDGHGFVYNVGYRVTASTCPLFTLFTALFYFFFRNIYLTGVILGVLFSTLAVYIIIFKVCNKNVTALLSVCILVCCYSFMSFATSGLENSLLYLEAALFLLLLMNNQVYKEKDLLALALVLSFIAMTRMDAVLVFVPAICTVYLFYTSVKFGKRVVIGLCGLLPFIVWELFSIIYYGFPFPNTMYIKLNTGFSKIEYYKRGIEYVFHSSVADVLLLVVPLLFVISSILQKSKKLIMVACGVVLYEAYVIAIGGDFMLGRHMTLPFLVSLVGLIYIFNEKEVICDTKRMTLERVLIVILAIGVFGGYSMQLEKSKIYGGMGDEKMYYYPYTGFLNYLVSHIDGEDSVSWYYIDYFQKDVKEIQDTNAKGGCLVNGLAGIAQYYAQEEKTLCLSDSYGLMDPLLSHLPAVWTENWRVGHMRREIPVGYNESLATGTNQIADKSLHDFYDKVLIITQGNLWDIDRLKVIINMNLGKYDYLIDEYLSVQ